MEKEVRSTKVDLGELAVLRGRGGVSVSTVLAEATERVLGFLQSRYVDVLSRAVIRPEQEAETVRKAVQDLAASETQLLPTERGQLIDTVMANVMGFGPLEALRHDPEVTDILVNNWDSVFDVRGGTLYQTDIQFAGPAALENFAAVLIAPSGRVFNAESPIVLVRVADGTRARIMRSPVTPNVTISMRKPQANVAPVTADTLIENGTWTPQVRRFLEWVAAAGFRVLFAGETNTGKTTSLRVFTRFLRSSGETRVFNGVRHIVAGARVVVLEHTRELELDLPNVLSREAVERPGGGGEDLVKLLKAALQEFPEVIIVGEILGAEALPFIEAALSGHVTYATIHAAGPDAAMERMVNGALMSGVALSERRVRKMAFSAVDLILEHHWHRGERRLTGIYEVVPEGDFREIFVRGATGMEFVDGISGRLAARLQRSRDVEVPSEWLSSVA